MRSLSSRVVSLIRIDFIFSIFCPPLIYRLFPDNYLFPQQVLLSPVLTLFAAFVKARSFPQQVLLSPTLLCFGENDGKSVSQDQDRIGAHRSHLDRL